MFQFPGFAAATYGFSDGYPLLGGLPHSEILGSKPARGSPRLFAACHVLHRLLAPRHPPDALAFLHPRQPPPQTAPHQACGLAGTPPAGAQRRRREKVRGGGRRRRIPTTTTKGRPCEERPAYPCQMTSRPQDGKTNKKAGTSTCRCPPRTTHEGSLLTCPRTGISHHLTMSKQHRPATHPSRRNAGTPGGPGPT